MSPQTGNAADESFLDDVFDAVSTEVARGAHPDVAAWIEERPHLEARIVEIVRLADDVWMKSPTTPLAIPGYELVRELGSGGMGAVFLARQSALADRLVALKVLPRGAALSRQARSRFHSEAAALARIRHPNVIDIYEVVDLESTPAYAMEWVDGLSLFDLIERWCEAGRSSSSAEFAQSLGADLRDERAARVVVRWGAQVADALTAAHAEGLLHRDVKPSNIMVRRDGTALLTDFGLVRDEDSALMTRSGAFLGTPAYAAPEQLRGDHVDERSDVYGLGATLYHALCGEPPFGGLRNHDVVRAIEAGGARPLREKGAGLPRDLTTIVETAMDTDPARRYATANALAEDLQRFLRGEPIHARPAGFLVKLGKYARRHRAGFYGALIGGVLAVSVAVMIAIYAVRQAGIPAEVAEHVRAARLLLLDPAFDERMAVMLRAPSEFAWNRRPPGDRLTAALVRLDAALALAEDPDVRAERETLVLVNEMEAEHRRDRFEALARLAPITLAVEREWRQRGAPPDVVTLDLEGATARDRRCLGLLASLRSNDALCIAAWRGLDLAAAPDPLVDAALGQLYRQRDQPALAWPRLERAYEHFGEAGFLGSAIAEVALRCGDPAYAIRVLDRDPEFIDSYDDRSRIRADALLALGRRDEARQLYLEHAANGNVTPSSHESLAAFLESDGEIERALHHHWRLTLRWPSSARTRRLAMALEARWMSLDAAGQTELLAGSRTTPGSFLDQLAQVRRSEALAETPNVRALAEQLELDHDRLRAWRHETSPREVASSSFPQHELELLSVDSAGEPANAACFGAALSGDGRFIAFVSAADNLVAGDTNRANDVFLRDRSLGTTILVSRGFGGVSVDGPSERPALSDDGRWIAFFSRANGLVPGDDNDDWDCFVFDRETETVACASVDPNGAPLGPPLGLGRIASSAAPAISGDGRRVAYARGVSRPDTELIVWDRGTGRRVWSGPSTVQRWTDDEMAFDRSGRWLWVTQRDPALVASDPNAFMADVLRLEVGGRSVVRLSEVGGRAADIACYFAGASRDGRWTLLRTAASNLATIDNPSRPNLLLRDSESGSVRRLNEISGRALRLTSGGSSTCGTKSAFCARSGDVAQVWVFDHAKNTLRVVSCTRTGTHGDGDSESPRLSGDGAFLVFATAAPSLLPPNARGLRQLVGRRSSR